MNIKKRVSNKTRTIRQSAMMKVIEIVTPRIAKEIDRQGILQVTTRPMIEFASEHFKGKPVVGAEIGVWQGQNAKSILQTLNVETLFLIDPYGSRRFSAQITKPNDALPVALKNLSHFKDRIEWVRKTSEDALTQFPDDFFDFVYVDGNHEYDCVKKDLQGYWNKVKKGGILGGHDLIGHWLGVCKAVIEFSKWMNEPLFGKRSDYWFIKDY